MGLFGRKVRALPTSEAPVIASPVWPDPKQSDTEAVAAAIDAYFNLPLDASIERIPDAFYQVTGAPRYNVEQSVWSWLAAWCARAKDWEADLVILKVAMFVFEWDREYTSGPGIMMMGKPKPEHLDAIAASARVVSAKVADWQTSVVRGRTVQDVHQAATAGR